MPNSEFHKKLRRSLDTERPAPFRPDDWDALNRRLDDLPPPATAAASTNGRTLLGGAVLALGILALSVFWWRAERALDQQRDQQRSLERQLAQRDAEIMRLRGALAAAQALPPAPAPETTVRTEIRYVDRPVERIVYRDRGVRARSWEGAADAAVSGTTRPPEVAAEQRSNATAAARSAARSPGEGSPSKSIEPLANPLLPFVPRTPLDARRIVVHPTEKERLPWSARLRPSGTYLNFGAGVGRPEVISSSETISHHAANAGVRLEQGIGERLQLLVGVDFWRVNYGGLNVRYLPDFLARDLDAQKNALQTPRHFLATQRMQRFSAGLKFLPSMRHARWQPYFAATVSLERARTERLLFVVYDELFRQNRMLQPETYHNQHFGQLAWVSTEMRPGVRYRFARRFAANVEGYYALPIDAGAREERFSPRAGLRFGIGYRL